jgi:periplasmic protein TonB
MWNPFIDRLNIDDLLFENRNKEYGAYILRKKYNLVLVTCLFIAILIVSSAIVIPYLIIRSGRHERIHENRLRYVEMQMQKLEPPKPEELIIPPPPPPPEVIRTYVRYIAPVVVDSIVPLEKTQPSVAEVQASPEDDIFNATSFPGQETSLIHGDGENGDSQFFIVEINPSFRGGGIEKFRDWVQKKVIYPPMARINGIQGKVFLTFIVERDGSVSNVKVVKGVDPTLDLESVKAIQASPKWSPGMQRGRPVRMRFSIYLNFSLN